MLPAELTTANDVPSASAGLTAIAPEEFVSVAPSVETPPKVDVVAAGKV